VLNLLAIILVMCGTVVGAFGSMYLKKGAKEFNFSIPKQLKNYPLITGVLLFVASSVFYFYGLSIERLSIIYPLTSLTYIWVAFISIRYLKEKMNAHKWIGIALIITGIFFLTYFAL
jgi:uncharacterized membrane protein